MAPVRLKFPDSLATALLAKNKAKPNFVLEIAKRFAKYLN
jgi:hypothetical protein